MRIVFALIILAGCGIANAADRPNIVFVLSDNGEDCSRVEPCDWLA